MFFFFFFQAEDGIRDDLVTGVQTCALPIFVVTAARPELLTRRPGWGSGRRGFVSIHLGSLTNEAMESLVLGLVPGITEEVAKSVVDRAGGIPLYAIELVRKLIADGVLVEEEGGGFCAVVGDI